MSIGLRQNNPGNLRAGSFRYEGEVAPQNGFRTFSSMAYGIRAWLKNLMYQKNVRGLRTYRQYINAYAPPSENPTNYPGNVVRDDFELDEEIKTDQYSLQTLFFNQAYAEIGNDADHISPADFAAGYNLYASGVGAALYSIGNVLPGNYFMVGMLIIFIAGLFTIFIVANKK